MGLSEKEIPLNPMGILIFRTNMAILWYTHIFAFFWHPPKQATGPEIRAFQVEVLPILSDATSTSFGGHGELQVWVHIQGAGAE